MLGLALLLPGALRAQGGGTALAGGTVTGSAQNLADPSNRIFFEDFADGLDQAPDGTHRWMTAYPFGGRQVRSMASTHDIECYTDPSTGTDPFTVTPRTAGMADTPALTITAAASAGNPCKLPYTSGIITTFGSFHMLYGYVEARFAVPQGAGIWPAFWMIPSDNLGRSELDILETWGFDTAAYYATGVAQFAGINNQTRVPLEHQEAFHRYGADWEADKIVWYLDGVPVKQMATPAQMHTPMYILLNLGIYGPGSFQAAIEQKMQAPPPLRFPAHLVITEVAAYRTQGTQIIDGPRQIVTVPLKPN
jgi:beta-glucanase (GH16 family)